MTDEKQNVTIGFSIGLRELIVGWTLLLVTWFALNLNPTYWSTMLFQTAIVVGAAVILLVFYERARGNPFTMPQIDFKTLVKYLVALSIAMIGLVYGYMFLALALGQLFHVVTIPELQILLIVGLLCIGSTMALLGIKQIVSLVDDDEGMDATSNPFEETDAEDTKEEVTE
jgi:hypothetical protein